MSALPTDHYTLDEFLKLEDGPAFPRSEFHDGLILPVESASPSHSLLCARIVGLLQTAFPKCNVYDSSLDLYVESVNRVFHPDATVLCGTPSSPKTGCISNPTILVEVSSPTTKDYDSGTKREYYFALSSLQHYLLVSQTEARVGRYTRSSEGWFYVDHYANSLIQLGETAIQVNAIYEGVSLT